MIAINISDKFTIWNRTVLMTLFKKIRKDKNNETTKFD